MKLSLSEVEELLSLYLSGDLSEKERILIDEWRKESPENESLYQESCRACEAIPLLNEMEKFNSFEALKKVNKRINRTDYSGWCTIIQRIAAILIMPVLMYAGYQTLQNFSMKKQQAENAVIQTVTSRQGMVSKFSLPDGTSVWLNSGSELQFPIRFTDNMREVSLKGEAFFEVVKNEKHPFRVNARDMNIDVMGTSFSVISYSDENQSEVILKEGKVRLSIDEGQITKDYGTMNPGQRAVYNEESQKIITKEVNPQKYIAWINGDLIFDDDPMEDVVKRLSRWFNVEIIIEDPEINEYIYKATFRNENLKQVLNLLKLSAPIDYGIIESKVLPDGEFSRQKIYLMKKKR